MYRQLARAASKRPDRFGAATLRLYTHLEKSLSDDLLVGPDPGVRFNYRCGRFVESRLSRVA